MEKLAIFLSCFMCRMDRADILLKLHAILGRAVSQTVGASLYPTNNVTRGISNAKNPFLNLQILVLSVSHILSVWVYCTKEVLHYGKLFCAYWWYWHVNCLPSVRWHCWLAGMKGIQPEWWGAGVVGYLGWRRGVVVSGVRQWTKLTHVGSCYNWDGWPSSGGYTISGCNQPTRSTQPCIPPALLNRVPASAGVKAGMSPLPGGR